jgi:hypothetical protein
MMVASPAGSKGQMVNPASASSWPIRMPRIEPVPTAPAPPIWKIDRSDPPIACSVRRSGSAGCCGRWVVRPQNGPAAEASHDSPSRYAARQISRPHVQPFAVAYHCGKAEREINASYQSAGPATQADQFIAEFRPRPAVLQAGEHAVLDHGHPRGPALSSKRPDQSIATSMSSVTARSQTQRP